MNSLRVIGSICFLIGLISIFVPITLYLFFNDLISLSLIFGGIAFLFIGTASLIRLIEEELEEQILLNRNEINKIHNKKRR